MLRSRSDGRQRRRAAAVACEEADNRHQQQWPEPEVMRYGRRRAGDRFVRRGGGSRGGRLRHDNRRHRRCGRCCQNGNGFRRSFRNYRKRLTKDREIAAPSRNEERKNLVLLHEIDFPTHGVGRNDDVAHDVDLAARRPAHGVKTTRNSNVRQLLLIDSREKLRILSRGQAQFHARGFKQAMIDLDVGLQLRGRRDLTDQRSGPELRDDVRLCGCFKRERRTDNQRERGANEFHGQRRPFNSRVFAKLTPVQARIDRELRSWALVLTGWHKPSQAHPNVLYLRYKTRATLTALGRPAMKRRPDESLSRRRRTAIAAGLPPGRAAYHPVQRRSFEQCGDDVRAERLAGVLRRPARFLWAKTGARSRVKKAPRILAA